jgi:hypothetical protein
VDEATSLLNLKVKGLKAWENDPKKQSSQGQPHPAQVPRSWTHRQDLALTFLAWKVTYGNCVMATALYLRESDFPRVYSSRAAWSSL